jgi:hypothetical protein
VRDVIARSETRYPPEVSSQRTRFALASVLAVLGACTAFDDLPPPSDAPPRDEGAADADPDVDRDADDVVDSATDVIVDGGDAGDTLFPVPPKNDVPLGSWCYVNKGDHAFCSDFDEDWPDGGLPSPWGEAAFLYGSVTRDPTYSSAPASALFAGDGGNFALGWHDAPGGQRDRLYAGLDVRPHGASYDRFDVLVLGGTFGERTCNLALRISSADTNLVVDARLDGGSPETVIPLTFESLHRGKTVPPEQWTRIELALDLASKPPVALVRIAGSVSDPVPLADGCSGLSGSDADRMVHVGICGDMAVSSTGSTSVDGVIVD